MAELRVCQKASPGSCIQKEAPLPFLHSTQTRYPGPKTRAERTPGAVAVSGKTEPGAGAKNFSSGFPQTNSHPSVNAGGFSVLPLTESKPLLNQMPYENRVGYPLFGSSLPAKQDDFVRQPHRNPCCGPSLSHSVIHYNPEPLTSQVDPGLGHYKELYHGSVTPSLSLIKDARLTIVSDNGQGGECRDSKNRASSFNAIAFDCRGKEVGKAIGLGGRDISVEVDSESHSERGGKTKCGAWTLISDCVSGIHHFAKKIFCHQEWCPVCGEDNSASHKQRLARLLPKIQQVSQLGYFVIEFPDWARHIGQRGIAPDQDHGEYITGWCYSKTDLRETANAIIGVLAGHRSKSKRRTGGYFGRGLGRWHWFGEQRQGKWNPHFNILVDSSYLSKSVLKQIKADLRAALNCPDLIVHYSYCDKPGQMVQKARYITRATFRDYSWSPYMARELYKFRNTRWWGNWKGEPAWEMSQAEVEGEDVACLQVVSKLQEGICPDCGQPLKVLYHNHKTGKPVYWSRPVDSVYLGIWSAQEIAGTGYYRIPHREWSGYSFSPGELLKLEEMKAKAETNPSVSPMARMARERVNDYWQRKREIREELDEMGL